MSTDEKEPAQDETLFGFRIVESDALPPGEVLLISPVVEGDPDPLPVERRAVLLRFDP